MTKVIYIHGAPAVGKLTTAKLLAEKIGFKLLHNHLTTDLVRALFERGHPRGDMYIAELRFQILTLGVKEKVNGIILTGAHAHNFIYPNGKTDDWFAQTLEEITETHGGEFYGVHLKTNTETLMQRVIEPDRREWGKIHTAEVLSDSIKLHDYTMAAVVKQHVTIDNTDLFVDEVVNQIVDFVHLDR